ncbi:MAG: acyl carrier protein [Clostridia bacterium]|nr:acyl carrier protein [Clostridia bacterium]
MNPKSELLEIIRRFKKVDENVFTESANMRLDLGLDSLQIASIAGEVEDAFGVEITDEQAVSAVTVGDWLELIDAQRK